ncbi:MAG: hypothetical protein AB2401_11020, partial [Bacillus sp. (in: firmicutes)]
LIQNSFLAMTCNMNAMTKSEDGLGEGKALNPLEEAIEFLERLQECQKRPTNYGSIDAQELINGQLDCVIEELKQFQIDLQTKNDHSCNCSH